jgi:hypothetical protein
VQASTRSPSKGAKRCLRRRDVQRLRLPTRPRSWRVREPHRHR